MRARNPDGSVNILTLNERQTASCMSIVGLLAVGLTILTMRACHPGPKASTKAPNAQSSRIDSTRGTHVLKKAMPVAFTEDAWDAMTRSDEALKAKISTGEAGFLHAGTQVTVTGFGLTYRELVPLDGPHEGKTGKVPFEWLDDAIGEER